MKKESLIGKHFSKLIVKELKGVAKNRERLWLCECECGGSTVASSSNLEKGNTTSCGCARKKHVNVQESSNVQNVLNVQEAIKVQPKEVEEKKDIKALIEKAKRGIEKTKSTPIQPAIVEEKKDPLRFYDDDYTPFPKEKEPEIEDYEITFYYTDPKWNEDGDEYVEVTIHSNGKSKGSKTFCKEHKISEKKLLRMLYSQQPKKNITKYRGELV
jgi:hypothetical protein